VSTCDTGAKRKWQRSVNVMSICGGRGGATAPVLARARRRGWWWSWVSSAFDMQREEMAVNTVHLRQGDEQEAA
jgi:hypothetical protein